MFHYSFHYAILHDNCEGVTTLLPILAWCNLFYQEDYQTQLIDLCQYAMQSGLMVHLTLEDSLAILWDDCEAAEPV